MPSRRAFLQSTMLPIGLGLWAGLRPGRLAAGDGAAVRRHALSLMGEPRYPGNFQSFAWVDVRAPKAGEARLRALGTFDTLNRFAPKGSRADGLPLVDATLMAPSLDEPSTEYAYVAEWASYPDDVSSVTFGLDPAARFSDGRPVTPEDVVFTLEALKKANPRYGLYFKNVTRAEKIGPREVRFDFDAPGNRELPVIVSTLPVLPRHYWTARDDKGEPRDLARGSLEVPVGAGPYRVAAFEAGRRIVYERAKDWWAKDLPSARGQYNFDRLVHIYYRDRLPAFEGFKVAETDFWPENSAKGWATEFDFDAARRGLVKREELPDGNIAGMQGFAFNLRRPQFADRRVREAFNLAFNFEWANSNMFFGQYKRLGSYFGNSELAAVGPPEGAELAILEPLKAELPPEVFRGSPYRNPTNSEPDSFRRHMARAASLLSEAGFELKDGVRTNAAGVRLTAEVLLVQENFAKLVLAYKAELAKLGIAIEVRVVDAALYRRRTQVFDFDIIVASFGQSHSPGNEQREFWGSVAAGEEGSRNVIGIRSPAIDAIIERLIYAKDRPGLVAATRALDRALLWGHYLVPHFHSPVDRVAYWDKFKRPGAVPTHGSPSDAFVRTWWYDEAAAGRLAEARKS